MFDINKLKNVMHRFVDNGMETGAAAVVMKDGEEALRYSCGLADAEKGLPFKEDTICRAFSCSKVVTGVAVMQLLEKGLISLEDRLEWFVPEFAGASYVRDGKRIAASRPLVLRDLLNMTSGIAYPGAPFEGADEMNTLWWELEQSIRNGSSLTTREFAARAGKCALMFDPGEQWLYGSSADVLGAVVESVTGTRFGDYLKENIFDPLGMKDTAFFVPEEKLGRLAVFYDGSGEGRKVLDWVNLCIFDQTSDPAFQSGGAGLFSTAEDYSKLGAALSNGSFKGERVLGRKTIDFLRQNALTPSQAKTFDWDACKGYGYANLMRMVTDRNAASTLVSDGAFGWDGWSGTYILNDPAERLAVVLFVQRAGAGTTALSRAVVNAVYSMLE
ncbi:MAG: beta-lactamase family protein [Ruminococcus sp.]|nr:beta-lactamase family protein [Ruminococcus sp.]